MIELVAFLGNHGSGYSRNRHNAGWLLAEVLPYYPDLSWREKFHGDYAVLEGKELPAFLPGKDAAENIPVPGSGNSGDGKKIRPAEKIHFIKPKTFMNLSGQSVQAAAAFFKIPAERILVVHDELELALGQASFKFSGGLGGHNGLRSMKSCFNTADFWRLRIGIGRPDHPDVSSWVLSDFAPYELPVLESVLSRSAEALTEALVYGPETLLPEWNKKRIASPA